MARLHLAAAGVLLLALGLGKLLSPQQLSAYLVAAHGVSLDVGAVLARLIAIAELALGALALTATMLQWRLTRPALLVLTVSLITVGYTLLVAAPVPCGCFGSIAHATKAHRLFVGTALVYLAASALVYAGSRSSLRPSKTPPSAARSKPS